MSDTKSNYPDTPDNSSAKSSQGDLDHSHTTVAKPTTPAPTLAEITETSERLQKAHIESLRAQFVGLRIIEDYCDMMCGPNGYVLVVGSKLWAKLKEGK